MRAILVRLTPDSLIILGLLILPIAFFAPVTIGGKTLIPADNLYQYEPWASHRAEQGVPEIPHNALLSDLIFQNYQWKHFLKESLSKGDIPLWQPNQFSGTPFLANGQHSAYYPFTLIYYILPLWLAFGWFTVSQLWLAGIFMYLLIRGLDLGRFAGVVAAVTYQLSGSLIVATVHPMIQAGAAWLPLLILMLEFIIQWRPFLRRFYGEPIPVLALIPWVLIGGVGLGMNFLAGHVEITYYTLLILAMYAVMRLAGRLIQRQQTIKNLLPIVAMLLLMVLLGLGIGAIQFIPLVETASDSFRTERSSLEEVRSYALPPRHIAKWLLPNVYGNPAHHRYFDVFEGETVSLDWQRTESDGRQTRITNTDFGIKNYVEGGVYLGILPLVFALIGLSKPSPYRLILILLGLIAALFMFGTPVYAVLYHLFPGVDQLHTPFRWSWLFTFVICVLAAYGAEKLAETPKNLLLRRLGYLLMIAGAVILAGLLISRFAYSSFEPLVERVFDGLAGANRAFPDARAFYSYQFLNLLVLGGVLLVSGLIVGTTFMLSSPANNTIHRPQLIAPLRSIPLWQALAVIVIVCDLFIAHYTFHTQADRAWLDYQPPAITWLQERQRESMAAGEGGFRIQAFNWGEDPLIANTGWQYGLEDVRGYDSLFSKQYADYMNHIAPQTGLDFNRINPILYDNPQALLAPELDALNVRYIITDWIIRPQEEFGVDDLAQVGLALVYEDSGVRIYENLDAKPRVYTLPHPNPSPLGEGLSQPTAVPPPQADQGLSQLAAVPPLPLERGLGGEATVTAYESSTVYTDVETESETWLIYSGTYAEGWRAFVRPQGADEDAEKEIPVEKIDGNFRGVKLDAGAWTVRWRYSPQSFQLGAFTSFISTMVVIFLLLIWAWQTFIAHAADQDSARRVVKNSLAPIILNLFNRGIDFAFAFVMLRILAPEGAGIYYYAIVVFGWFDILTNFGLNTLLTREVARDHSQARRYLLNTTALRLGLAGIGIPALAVFLLLRNNLVSPPLEQTALIAILLLYGGLIPNSLSTGLSALFYAFEKAEYPAALSTVSTLVKVSLGLGALLTGWGVIGLAGVSILTNLVTLILMIRLALPLLRQVSDQAAWISKGLMRGMMLESYPLMINHLLATIFFKVDVILLEAIQGAVVVGTYSTAYKWLDALNIVPAFFTMALLPLMSRQAHDDREGLRRNYIFAFKSLVMVALPVTIVTTYIAHGLIGVLGGEEFLPDGGIALQIMIWSIPIGWINSLTQYVLIALDRQRQITFAFVAAVSFNLIGNLIFIPAYSYRAAAIITILSELALLIGFYYLLREDLGRINYIQVLWKPIIASSVTLGVILLMAGGSVWFAMLIAAVIYPAVLVALKPLSAEEGERMGRVLPARVLRLLVQ
jgi:O-antigen/teichoic acid export membrane protein